MVSVKTAAAVALMMAEDDSSYRKSVRNTLIVLAAIVLTIVGSLLVLPAVNPVHEQFSGTGSIDSPYGFSLSIQLNTTNLTSGEGLAVTARVNSTSSQIGNISAASRWPIGPQALWTRICTNGWPLGVGVMAGYYTADNYSLGSLIRVPMPLVACPISIYTPKFFLLQPRGSTAIVNLDGALTEWNLTTALGLRTSQLPAQSGGVYTAIAADEWGDVVLAHFRASQ